MVEAAITTLETEVELLKTNSDTTESTLNEISNSVSALRVKIDASEEEEGGSGFSLSMINPLSWFGGGDEEEEEDTIEQFTNEENKLFYVIVIIVILYYCLKK